MLLNMAAAQDALKNYYIDAVRHQMDVKADPLMAMIEKTSDNIQGDKIVRYLRYGKNGGVASSADDAAMPASGARKGQQITTGTKNVFGRLELTDKVIKATQGSRGSFISYLETQMEELLADAKENVARQVHGDGSGVICTASGWVGKVITLTNVDDANLLYEGMLIDMFSADGATQKLTATEITIVDRVLGKVTVKDTPSGSTAAGELITVQNSKGNELTGLKKILTADNTIYGVDRATNKWFNPNIINVNGAIEEITIQKGIDTTEIRSGKTPDFLMASYGVKRAYMDYMLTYKRNTNTLDVKGGFKAVDFNGIPMVNSKYRSAGSLALLDTSAFKMDRLEDWSFIDENGSILTRVTGFAKYEAILAMYADMICDLAGSQTYMYGITEA